MASNSLLRRVALPLSNRGETFSQTSAHNKHGGARPRSDWPKSLRNFGASGASEGLASRGDLCPGSNLRALSLSLDLLAFTFRENGTPGLGELKHEAAPP